MTAPGKAKPEKRTYGTEQLAAMLGERYRGDDATVVFEVRNDAGFSASRSCDAIAIGFWPSRGNMIEGFEIKASRGDWLRELKEPVKAEAFYRFVDRWWIVAPRECVKDNELPPTWGLLVPRGDGLIAAHTPPINMAREPMPKGMLAALVKRASMRAPMKAELEKVREEARKRGHEAALRNQEWEVKRMRERLAEVEEFEKATGIRTSRYGTNVEQLMQAVALVKAGGHHNFAQNLDLTANRVEALAGELRRTAAALNAVQPNGEGHGAD